MILALWIWVSYFLFDYFSLVGILSAVLMFLFALLSYKEQWNKMHLFQVLPTGLLIYLGFSYPTPWLPMGLQNYLIVAALLAMFCLIPSHASDQPRPWKRFLKDHTK
ncbi:MAG: hypothetical protein ACD_17C00078G0003 [uncultured bacterium]|nr:MAG: hypothetical protein ACD_17C00078G0003 [uncultured bacterium]OGN56443.1 MAG: hypothetical protein A2796_03405 [Chlamydiae bacterium RIFCSPHIGHO2_01_FULL_44_39]OGN57137.1 MAG: hypothetical protein A3C42_02750 [Chlamydiae bacterium RIFCSPHIGHO2_02_FULL_45_9]OGN60165.1 MAG: hypothetical protein A3D96_04930 [Chlamydiae bacterium RIFCSPHIGHO2_12_FULL_44_59]OGN67182.1 MAG: hypothetical protein A2978_01110 [Chlamydiae bacterium RIFCSPLOWO2_01_FULL_44_52]OGN67772.1 MAG: hypothetical protein A3